MLHVNEVQGSIKTRKEHLNHYDGTPCISLIPLYHPVVSALCYISESDLWRAGAHSANEGSENWLLLNLLTVICFQALLLSLAVRVS